MAHIWYIVPGIMTASNSEELINQSYYSRNRGDQGHLGWSENCEADTSFTKYQNHFTEWDLFKEANTFLCCNDRTFWNEIV
jgi:hypothetical protein